MFWPPILISYNYLFQFIEHAWSEPFVDNIVRQNSKILRSLYGVFRELKPPEAKQLLVIVLL